MGCLSVSAFHRPSRVLVWAVKPGLTQVNEGETRKTAPRRKEENGASVEQVWTNLLWSDIFPLCLPNPFCSLLSQQHMVLLEHLYHYRPFQWVRWEWDGFHNKNQHVFFCFNAFSTWSSRTTCTICVYLSRNTWYDGVGSRGRIHPCLSLVLFLYLISQHLVLLECLHKLCLLLKNNSVWYRLRFCLFLKFVWT